MRISDWSSDVCSSDLIPGAAAGGKEPVVADAMEARRQDVEEKAADELIGGEGHALVSGATLGAVVLAFEGDAVVVEGGEAPVGDGDAELGRAPCRARMGQYV